MSVLIANGSGFWGDQIDAPVKLIQKQPHLDYITMDYLSEVSMSILATQREKNKEMGYAADFLKSLSLLAPKFERIHFKLITNAGGLNPLELGKQVKRLLDGTLKRSVKIAVVTGDDVLETLRVDPKNSLYANLDTKEELTAVHKRLATANAYVGAGPIVEALVGGADIIITGRIADPSLAVAPALYHHKWSFDDFDKIAQATLAGHLIECGTQATGGLLSNWTELSDVADMGFPYVEIEEDGTFIITKPKKTGGVVSVRTVKEQMVYEIGDPSAMVTPDVIVSFLDVNLQEVGQDRVRVSGAKGKKTTDTYKVSASVRRGWRAESTLALFGDELVQKCQKMGEVILERVKMAGYKIDRSDISCVGYNAVTPLEPCQLPLYETMMRIAVSSDEREAVERFTKEVAPLVTSGPAGVTGYVGGRAPVREEFAFWPCLIPKKDVHPKITFLTGGGC
jgi:hypothetical protein